MSDTRQSSLDEFHDITQDFSPLSRREPAGLEEDPFHQSQQDVTALSMDQINRQENEDFEEDLLKASPKSVPSYTIVHADLGESQEFDWDKEDSQKKIRNEKGQLMTNRWARFLAWYKRFSPLTRTILYIASGFILTFPLGLMSLFVDCTYNDDFTLPDGSVLPAPNMLARIHASWNMGGAPLFLWSLWSFICWSTFFAMSHVVRVLPRFLSFVVDFVLGGTNEFTRHYLDYIRYLRHYASLTFVFIVSYFSYIWIFPVWYWQIRTGGSSWPSVLSSLLLCLLMAGALLTGEKLALQYIAVGAMALK
jgi:hypothetical protein